MRAEPFAEIHDRLLSLVNGSGPEFILPPELEASTPPEGRGLARDEVRLMVSHIGDDSMHHARFRDLPAFLKPGDLLVVNTSGTIPASLPAHRADGAELRLHLSTQLPDGLWIVELRKPAAHATIPFGEGIAWEQIQLPAGGSATLLWPKMRGDMPQSSKNGMPEWGSGEATNGAGVRLWVAKLDLPEPLLPYLAAHGAPIRYGYLDGEWPIEFYQTVFGIEPGSAEMPSAGRAFTHEIVTRLMAGGVMVAPLLLHTGVASLEGHEPPYEEYYHLPAPTARLVNMVRADGGNVIAVGTTVTRALESAVEPDGTVRERKGWTDLVITAERGMRAVDGMITGLHEPSATHLAMLEALAGKQHLRKTYAEALRERYLWHEFGDLHMILP